MPDRPSDIVDLDVTPDQKRMLITYENDWNGE